MEITDTDYPNYPDQDSILIYVLILVYYIYEIGLSGSTKNKMRESDFQTLFTKYVRQNWSHGSAAFELKITKTGSLPFSRLEEHQLEALKKSKDKSLFHKISDMSLNAKPFDCFVLQEALAYVAVLFYEEREEKVAYLIDVDAFILESQTSIRKSLTKDRARQIAHYCVTL